MPEILNIGTTLPGSYVTAGRIFRPFEDVTGRDGVVRRFYGAWTNPAIAKPTWSTVAEAAAYAYGIKDIHAGGFRTGLYLHDSTQTLFTRGDVASFHRRAPLDTRWTALHDANRYTGAPPSMYQIAGFAVAPSSVNHFVAVSKNDVASSTDGGVTLRHSKIGSSLKGNDDPVKRADNRVAIDPRDPLHVLIGGTLRVHRSIDGGVTWTDIATPITTSHSDWGNTAILFDDRAGAPVDVNGRTLRWWVACNGTSDAATGFYRTDDGGATYTRMPFKRADGTTDESAGIVYGLRRFPNGDLAVNVWSDLLRVANPTGAYTQTVLISARTGSQAGTKRPSSAHSDFNDIRGFAFDPNAPDSIIVADSLFYTSSGYVFITYDGGANWKTMTVAGTNGTDGATWPTKTSATNNWTVGSFIWKTNGELWMSDGMGTWKSTSPILTAASTATSITFEHASAGLEDIVVNSIHKVPNFTMNGVPGGGALLMAGWDRSMWRWAGTQPADPLFSEFGSAWSIASCRKFPNVIAFVDTNHQPGNQPQRSAVSTDGGATFTPFGAVPASLMFGNIAISSQNPNKMVWMPSEGGNIHWSADQGVTWTESTYTGTRGFHEKHYLHRNVLCADPYNEDTFYTLNQVSSTSTRTVMRSTNGGKDWVGLGDAATLGIPAFDKNFAADLKAVPDGAGNTILYMTLPYFAGKEYPLHRGTFDANGALTFTTIAACPEALRVGEGAPINGVPVVYCIHRVATSAVGVPDYQVSRSVDKGVTWTKVSDEPLGRNDRCAALVGDPQDPGKFYLGYDGTGVIERRVHGVGSELFDGSTFYVNPESAAKTAADGVRVSDPAMAEQLDKIANSPVAIWAGDWILPVGTEAAWIDERVDKMEAAGALPVFVLYNIPVRDLNGYSNGGATSADAYRTWITNILTGLGSRKAVLFYEPDALGHLNDLTAAQRSERVTLMTETIRRLADAGHQVYTDAGHSAWHPVATWVNLLNEVQAHNGRGIVVNVSNFRLTTEVEQFATDIAVAYTTGTLHTVVDTSRNGNGPDPGADPINPPGRALGEKPTTVTASPRCDAYFWVKAPGESDGADGSVGEDGTLAPAAGEFWRDYAYGLAKRAKYGPFLRSHKLVDDFASLDTVKWPGTYGATLNLGRIRIVPASSYPRVSTGTTAEVMRYSLAQSHVAVEVPVVPSAGAGTVSATLQAEAASGANGQNAVEILWQNGNLICRELVDGSGYATDVSMVYDPVAHRRWRLRHDGSILYWETSPDGVTWTIRRQGAPTVNVTKVALALVSGFYGTEDPATVGFAEFDNFNV